MNVIQLLPIGKFDTQLLAYLQHRLSSEFGTRCEVANNGFDPAFSFHANRQQYHSTEILAHIQRRLDSTTWRVLGVTGVDLYIPILTFVFGEAQLNNPCAVVSFHRLRQEFYGLPADDNLLKERLLKEAVHELGHTIGLKHCRDYACVMAASHAVEWIDLKGISFCPSCRARLRVCH
jgi:archaemetzincin